MCQWKAPWILLGDLGKYPLISENSFKITDRDSNLKATVTHVVVDAAPADALAPLGSRALGAYFDNSSLNQQWA